MSGLLFLALLMVVVSGLIAYIGDLIGRKMGRKRLTLFGLRPRYTAIVISVAAGMVIALCTLAAAFIVSRPIRDAFIIPRETLQAQIEHLNTRLTEEKGKLHEAEMQSAQAKEQAEQALQQREQALLKVADVRKKLTNLEKSIEVKRAQLAKVQEDLKRSKHELEVSEEKVLNSGKTIIAQGKQLVELDKQLDNLKAEKEKLQAEIDAMDPFILANFTQLAFASGQEILSGLIPTRGSPDTRKVRLRNFLGTAERIVQQQCPKLKLKPGENAIVYLRVDDNNMTEMTEGQAVEMLSNRLAGVKDARDAIVRLTSANNVPVNGKAFIIVNEAEYLNVVQIIPNTQVYSARDEIAHIDMFVTPQVTAGDILTRLMDDLVREKVPDELREKGLLLILRRFDPGKPENTSASPSLLPWSDLAAAMEKARQLSGRVTVTARSSKTMNRFDPLDLTLEVVPTP